MVQFIFFLLAAFTRVPDESQLEILTPSLEERQTSKVRLSNGIEVLLISDPGVHNSGAALSVEVGSWQDPDTRHGQAHICEHMLFLGNAKYPEEGGLKQFLDDHGGRANAGTGDQMTFYMFSVSNDAFSEAVDRFSHMFISPLFTDSALSREVRAVNQEFVRDTELDIWREHHVEQELGRPGHPFSRFAIGNLDTLGDLSHDEIQSWFEHHYSANLMHLVMISPLPLDRLEKMATKHFASIPNRKLKPFVVSGPRLTEERRETMLVIEPHQKLRQLVLTWELPYEHNSSALDQISFVLGHEGEGSLLAHLKSQGLAETLATDVSRHRKPHTTHCLFGLRIGLTSQGLARKDEVLAQVLGGIEQLEIPAYVHEEMIAMQCLNYAHQTREDAFTAVSQHARLLIYDDLATYPDSLFLSKYCDPAPLLAQLTPETCCVTLIAPDIATTHTETWMKSRYALEGIEKRVTPIAISPPEPNPYIPTDLAIHPTSGEIRPLQSDEFGTSYFAPDTHYFVPEIAWSIRIKSAAAPLHDSASAVLTDLLIHATNEALATTSYTASMAGLDYSLAPADEGLTINVAGYSEKADLLLKNILISLANTTPSRLKFVQYKDALKRQYQNRLRTPPVEQAIDLAKGVLYRDHHTAAEKLRALNRISYDHFLAFAGKFREKTYTETLLFGNLSETQAEQIVDTIRGYQQLPHLDGRTSSKEVVRLPEDAGPYYLVKKIKSPGSALVFTVQQGDFSHKTRAVQQLLGRAIAEPFYTELRTRQQTGYVVWSWDQEIERQLFTFFALQSSSHNTRDLLARFELFIESFLRDLPSKARFEAIKASLIDALARTPKNPQEMAALLTTLAFQHEGDFDFLSKRITALQALDYETFTSFAHETFSPTNRRRTAFFIEGQGEALTWKRARSAKQLRECCSYVANNPA